MRSCACRLFLVALLPPLLRLGSSIEVKGEREAAEAAPVPVVLSPPPKRTEALNAFRASESAYSIVDKAAKELSNQESIELLQTLILGGKPGVAFPNYARAPRTKFHCKYMDNNGMYADMEARCQSYHMCHGRRMDTFLCPTGTLFNQALMTCDFWFNVNCDDSARFYSVNLDVYNSYQPASTTPRPWRASPTRVSRTTGFAERPAESAPPTAASRRPIPTPSSTTRRPVTTRTTTTTRRPVTTTTTTERVPVYIPSSTPRSAVFDDEGPDWVYAWLQNGNKSTVAPRDSSKRMSLTDFPLFAPKTETAFDFLSASNEPNKPVQGNNFGFSVSHDATRKNDRFSRAFNGQPTFVARAHNEFVAETGNHPSPWLFPIDTEAGS